jgi:hypothetical protein
MLPDNTYNLIVQLVEESKALWRIKNEYLGDAEGFADSIAFWQEMEASKENQVKQLTEMVKNTLE